MNGWLAIRQMLALALAAVLAACGPGVAGTGTDSVTGAFDAYGASTAPLCASSLAASLDCPTGGSPATASGTGPVAFVDSTTQWRLTVVYLGQTVRLEQRCTGLVFTGEWGLTLGGGRFFGIATLPGESEPQAAALSVQPQADGSQRIELWRVDNRQLLAPTPVVRATLPLGKAVCGT